MTKKSVKKLYRSKSDSMIGGVCGGLGEYFQIDSTLIRILYVLLLVLTGFVPLIIAYIVLWIIIPEK